MMMHLSLYLLLLSVSKLGSAFPEEASCMSFLLESESNKKYVTCKGNFTDLKSLKMHLQNITDPITSFELEDAVLYVLPPDMFHDVSKPEVERVIFDNVTLELLEVPELGDPPLESIKDTVESLEIYSSSNVFAWNFPSLSLINLKKIIISDSELISLTIPFFFFPKLQFVQIYNASLRWISEVAFKGNDKLAVCSLAHNSIRKVSRSMFPYPANKLYSLDLSFNRLESLPSDMFKRMDALHELKLDNNQLESISLSPLLMPVWSNLNQLWLDGNVVECHSLCWITAETEKPMFLESSKCKFLEEFVFIFMYLGKCAA